MKQCSKKREKKNTQPASIGVPELTYRESEKKTHWLQRAKAKIEFTANVFHWMPLNCCWYLYQNRVCAHRRVYFSEMVAVTVGLHNSLTRTNASAIRIHEHIHSFDFGVLNHLVSRRLMYRRYYKYIWLQLSALTSVITVFHPHTKFIHL